MYYTKDLQSLQDYISRLYENKSIFKQKFDALINTFYRVDVMNARIDEYFNRLRSADNCEISKMYGQLIDPEALYAFFNNRGTSIFNKSTTVETDPLPIAVIRSYYVIAALLKSDKTDMLNLTSKNYSISNIERNIKNIFGENDENDEDVKILSTAINEFINNKSEKSFTVANVVNVPETITSRIYNMISRCLDNENCDWSDSKLESYIKNIDNFGLEPGFLRKLIGVAYAN